MLLVHRRGGRRRPLVERALGRVPGQRALGAVRLDPRTRSRWPPGRRPPGPSCPDRSRLRPLLAGHAGDLEPLVLGRAAPSSAATASGAPTSASNVHLDLLDRLLAEGDAQRDRHEEREAVHPEHGRRLAVELAEPRRTRSQWLTQKRARSVAIGMQAVPLVPQVPAGQVTKTSSSSRAGWSAWPARGPACCRCRDRAGRATCGSATVSPIPRRPRAGPRHRRQAGELVGAAGAAGRRPG